MYIERFQSFRRQRALFDNNLHDHPSTHMAYSRTYTHLTYNVDRRLNYCRATERLTVSVSDDAVNWEQVAHKEVEEEQQVHPQLTAQNHRTKTAVS